jgi:hypothetical protein
MCISVLLSTWLDSGDFAIHLTSSKFTIRVKIVADWYELNENAYRDSSSIHITATCGTLICYRFS